jgi:hypothetical protein
MWLFIGSSVPLGAAEHRACPHVAEWRPGDRVCARGARRLDLGHRGRLVDLDAAPLGRRRDPGHQAGRLHPGAGRRVQAAERAGHLDPLACLVAGQELVDVIAVSPRADRGQPVTQPRQL